jgi:cytosine/uracil/thiamine/allantoin permease
MYAINPGLGNFANIITNQPVICPWKILYSAQAFTNCLGGYITFMGSAVGIMVADCYFISRGNIVLYY